MNINKRRKIKLFSCQLELPVIFTFYVGGVSSMLSTFLFDKNNIIYRVATARVEILFLNISKGQAISSEKSNLILIFLHYCKNLIHNLFLIILFSGILKHLFREFT